MALRIAKLPVSLRGEASTFLRTSYNFCNAKPRFNPKWSFVPHRCFWEPYREGHKRYVREKKPVNVQDIRESMSLLKGEIKMWKEEMKEKLASDPKVYVPGDTEILWTFESQEKLDKWITTADKDNNDGFSECEFTTSKYGKGLFCGTLSTRLPKDGIVTRTGYCNISAMKAMKSFMRKDFLDWSSFTHLVLRIRGDGRTYMVNLMTAGDFDVSWHDMFSFVLHTRGGPYWQIAMLPFSRFLLSSKGVIQDKQARIPLDMITSLGITCADGIPGNFRLEIDYIGVHLDGNFTEEFAYETYTYGHNLLW